MKEYKLPWIHSRRRTEVEVPLKPPIHLGALSNGEVLRQDTPASDLATRMILEKADEGARRLGLERREFLASSMGMATSLWVMNVMSGCEGGGAPERASTGGGRSTSEDGDMAQVTPGGDEEGPGGFFDVPDDPTDPEKVCERALNAKDMFIFDIQTHHVNRANTLYDKFLREQIRYSRVCLPQGTAPLACFAREAYTRLMFLESHTTVAVLSGLPAVDDENNPITNSEIAESKKIIDMMAEDSERLINHHMVLPNQKGKAGLQAQLDAMERTLQIYGKVGAWKCYPAWSPNNTEANAKDGWFLDGEYGVPFVEKGLELGVGTFCIHKGLPIPAFSPEYNNPRDIGAIAKKYPKANFIVYHSGYGNQRYNEVPYPVDASGNPDPKGRDAMVGTNSLITSLLVNGVGRNANVYAELGTTWQLVSTSFNFLGPDAPAALRPTGQMAHLIGKLLKFVGVDNVVWGTDSIWYGSPQSQIDSFLAFQISNDFQTRFGYPALTPEIKAKILGLNAARVYGINPEATRCAVKDGKLAQMKRDLDGELGERRWSFHEPMMRTRREFWSSLREKNFRPG